MHLILHKVRGAWALDVAEQLKIGEEDGWIIPTSGHRAHPFFAWNIDSLSNSQGDVPASYLLGEPPEDLPDHYPVPERKPTVTAPGKIVKIDLDDLFS